MEFYIAIITARNTLGIASNAVGLIADDRHDASQVALKTCLDRFPPAKGYHGQQAEAAWICDEQHAMILMDPDGTRYALGLQRAAREPTGLSTSTVAEIQHQPAAEDHARQMILHLNNAWIEASKGEDGTSGLAQIRFRSARAIIEELCGMVRPLRDEEPRGESLAGGDRREIDDDDR